MCFYATKSSHRACTVFLYIRFWSLNQIKVLQVIPKSIETRQFSYRPSTSTHPRLNRFFKFLIGSQLEIHKLQEPSVPLFQMDLGVGLNSVGNERKLSNLNIALRVKIETQKCLLLGYFDQIFT